MNNARQFVISELTQPVPQVIHEFILPFTEKSGLLAILFYGSCLHQAAENFPHHLLDFYLLTENDRVGESLALQWAGTLLPPNVFYREASMSSGTILRAKYAIMSLQSFCLRAEGKKHDSSIWARFSQPARLVWVKDKQIEQQIADAQLSAVQTLMREGQPLIEAKKGEEFWAQCFRLTYSSELRTEKADRAAHIIARDQVWYENMARFFLGLDQKFDSAEKAKARKRWGRRAFINKSLNILRLTKAAFTFQGGMKYILWKIERHSGVKYEPSPWQLRHPILAAPLLAWKLYRKGAFR